MPTVFLPGGYRTTTMEHSTTLATTVTGGRSAELDAANAWLCDLYDYSPYAYLLNGYKQNGFSVRCVKD